MPLHDERTHLHHELKYPNLEGDRDVQRLNELPNGCHELRYPNLEDDHVLPLHDELTNFYHEPKYPNPEVDHVLLLRNGWMYYGD